MLRQIRGKLLILCDGAPIYRSQPIKHFLASRGAKRIHLEHSPSYTPELSPDEGICTYRKRMELKNVCCHELKELRYERRLVAARLRHKRALIKAYIHHAGVVPYRKIR